MNLDLRPFVVLLVLFAVGCRETEGDTPAPKRNQAAPTAAAVSSGPGADVTPAAPAPKPAPVEPPSCPPQMKRIPGGSFWVGTLAEVFDQEENPRFRTTLPAFCADSYEISVAEYEACVREGKCTPAHDANQKTCNTSEKGRGAHPINCIDHHQAEAACRARGARLPTEVEWEYLARGGSEMRKFPWGEQEPDGLTCWKNAGTCERGAYPPGAFGLYDVSGNVWEWTSSWFGRYPWPAAEGRHRVYRGGSWSRRFEKWMRPNLRNRLDPKGHGSHLGARCVVSLPAETCPYGKEDSGECRFGVDEVSCLSGQEWNGIRCASKGDEARCPPGTSETPGHGCVRERTAGAVAQDLDLSAVSRTRSPEFDADCRTISSERPLAYKLTGGEHLARNAVGKHQGCKNRDVGVGFNSACCP